jgi:hypothetical protein
VARYWGYKQPYGFWVWTQQCGDLSPMFGHGYLSTMKISFNNEHRGFNQFWSIISTFIFWIFLAILMSDISWKPPVHQYKNMSWIIFMNQNLDNISCNLIVWCCVPEDILSDEDVGPSWCPFLKGRLNTFGFHDIIHISHMNIYIYIHIYIIYIYYIYMLHCVRGPPKGGPLHRIRISLEPSHHRSQAHCTAPRRCHKTFCRGCWKVHRWWESHVLPWRRHVPFLFKPYYCTEKNRKNHEYYWLSLLLLSVFIILLRLHSCIFCLLGWLSPPSL